MDDEHKKPSRKGGHAPGGRKPGGPRGGAAKGGKAGFGGKAGKPRFGGEGGKPKFEGKPFRAGGKPASARHGEASGERPARGDKPFRKPREGGEAASSERAERPYRSGPRPEGRNFEGKPFKPRGEGNQRPGRFERSAPRDGGDAARPERADRPFRAGPRPQGKPFAKRHDDERTSDQQRPPRRFERDDRPRGEGERPRRFERDDRPRGDGERPRRFERDDRPRGENERPRRFERDDRPRGDGERPRRFEKPSGDGPRPERQPFEKRPAGAAKSFGDKKPFARAAMSAEEAGGERIAKRLARVGIASRRDAEELIAAGRVRVNGRVLETPAFNVTTEDVIELDGQPLPPVERTRLFLFHKPAGVVTTSRDPEGRRTVFDVLPGDLPRLITIGRLDINTEGLLLLTNDGGLARTLELPATGWLRRYRARVHGKVEESALAGLKDGIAVDGVFYGAIEASLDREQGTNAWLTLGLREGKNREVKNILGALGLDVTRLIRVSFGPFQLGELPEGHVQELKGRMLREQLGDRLIEESGANFEADIVKPFSNKPTRRTDDRHDAEARPAARPLNIGEGGLIKARKRRENSRDDALGKLSTKPDRGGFGAKPERGPKPEFGARPPRGKKPGEREQRPIEPPGGRKANVWMAPGARPIGKGRAEAEKAAVEAKRARKPAFGKPGAKPFGKPRGEGRDAGRPPRGGKPPRKGE